MPLPNIIKPKKRIKKGYEIATFEAAQAHLQTQMYRRKRITADGDEDY